MAPSLSHSEYVQEEQMCRTAEDGEQGEGD